jgi:hypothetical protein
MCPVTHCGAGGLFTCIKICLGVLSPQDGGVWVGRPRGQREESEEERWQVETFIVTTRPPLLPSPSSAPLYTPPSLAHIPPPPPILRWCSTTLHKTSACASHAHGGSTL